jgi:hypothetical protein
MSKKIRIFAENLGKMTTLTLSTNNLQFVHLFENLANVLNVSFEKKDKTTSISKSMQKALDDEKNGRVTKLVNHKNAVAEILG